MVTPFEKNIRRVTAETAETRNRFMIELAEEAVIGFASKGGMLERITDNTTGKNITRIS